MKRALRAIALREAGSFLRSAVSPVAAIAFLLLTGISFVNILLEYDALSRSALSSGQSVREGFTLTAGVVQPLVSSMALFLMFVMPAITMRMFAEEYRSGRYGLVMTYPVSEPTWVAGKFAAAWALGLILLAAACANLLMLSSLAAPDLGALAAALLGLALAAAMMASWGLFFSTLQPYQIVSYILSFSFLTLLFTAGNLEPYLPDALAPLASRLSLPERFARFARGAVDARDILYFTAWTALGLAASSAALAGRRLAGARRAARWATPLVLAALLVVLDLFAARAPLVWDWTRDRGNSLSPQTLRVLSVLDRDVEVAAFYQPLDPRRRAVEAMLASFHDRMPGLAYRVFDPETDLARVQEYGVTTERSVIVTSGERRRSLLDPDENALVNAVYRVVSGTRPVVYHVQGHGERRLDDRDRTGMSACAEAVGREGYVLRTLLLPAAPEIPADAAVVVLASPRTEFSAAELAALDRYVARGGALLLLLDPGTPASLAEWLRRFNVGLRGDFLVTASRANAQLRVDELFMITDAYGPHEITRGLEGMVTLFPFCQSLAPLAATMRGVDARTLILSDESSWSEADPAAIARGRPVFDEGLDQPGPLPFAVALTVDRDPSASPDPLATPETPADTEVTRRLREIESADAGGPRSVIREPQDSRLVVFGDADFAANSTLNLYGNRDLLLNTLGWLSRDQVLIAARAPGAGGEPLVLTALQRRLAGWICIGVWPLLVGLLATVAVVRRRRHH
ncbi:MAG: Gldg family protein [Candidatus Latescibacteria bacterium]|nr:Gldg family protein [Candidatus Latescibacterota bacterium]